jgi:hypothetical protein
MTTGPELKQASIHVVSGHSLVVPLIIEGLPETIVVLGKRWRRKREFHLTAVAERVIESLDPGEHAWNRVIDVASGRDLGTITVRDEIRRVRSPEQPGLETLIVMADCPGLERLYSDLSSALAVQLSPPPAHVTLYSTDPAAGIGIVDEAELAERAPALTEKEQAAVRGAMSFP